MRKGQGGTNAAVLVAIIAGLIILYIIFLPATERESLLENKTASKGSGGSSKVGKDLLLREFPGRINNAQGVLDRTIPNIFLFERTDAKELESLNPITVRNGWFDKNSRTVSFSIKELDNTDNVILSLKAKKHDGALAIKLNNELVFESEADSETIAPIRLKKNLLRGENVLEFSVSSVGFRFWKTNEYSLEELRILGDITDKSKQESKNIFTLTSEELSNIDSAELRFVPYCKSEDKVGVLDIFINNKNIFSSVPVCTDPYKQPIPLGLLNEAENRIIFRTNKGSYSVEQIKIEFVEKEAKPKVYFFELNQSQVNAIKIGNKDAVLTIEFVDDRENKRADLNINDRLRGIDQKDKVYTKKLNSGNNLDLLKEGNNFIEIRPRTMLDIVEVRVQIQDR